MKYLLAILLSLCCHIGAHEWQKPPAPLPAEMPKLSPILSDAAGHPITTTAEWQTRRAEIKTRWQAFLGEFPAERAALNAKILETEELPEFTRQHVEYQIEEGIVTDGYLLTPKNSAGKTFPGMVVFHPTTKSQAKEPAGIDGERPERMHAVQLVKRGYVVFCPRCYIFDEGADFAGNVKKVQARHSNWTGMARMTFDTLRAADYMASLPIVDKERLGCLGHSLGAKEVLYALAFDERYKAGVFSEGGIGMRFTNWEAVWYLGARVKNPDFDWDHNQILALAAPRAFLLLAGESADTDKSWAYIENLMPLYKMLGAPENVGWLNHRLGHNYPPNAQSAAETFLDLHLKK